MEQDEKLTRKLKRYCYKNGIDIVGFADPGLFDRYQKYNAPEYFLEGTKTVIVIGIHLFDINLDAWTLDSKHNWQFADSVLETYCSKLGNFLLKRGYISKIISYAPGFFLKEAAALAGLGAIGKNNLLITEKFGSQVRLRALITNAPLKYGKPIFESTYCENCTKCIDACPPQAFVNGKYIKSICRPYNLAHLTKLSDNTSIWCNVCIKACPIGKS